MQRVRNDSIFHIPLRENECFLVQQRPAPASKSRMMMYAKAIETLPQPPALWNAFQRACDNGEPIRKLGAIISDDPVLSASVLRIANAPGLGALTEITDIARAICHLGISLVRSIVIQHAFGGASSSPGKVYDVHRLWKHGMAVSALAEVVASYIPDCRAAEAGTLGLFHDIGKMCFNLFPEYMLPAMFNCEKGHLMFEHARFACTHVELGEMLARHWELPERIVQGIRYHHYPAFAAPDEIPAVVRAEVFAVYLADMMAIHMAFDTGDSGIVLPHEDFASMFQGTSLCDVMASARSRTEMARIEAIEF